MDECESLGNRKNTPGRTPRPPLVPAEKNTGVTSRLSRIREVSSRYNSPSPSTPPGPRRFPSPNVSRTVPTSSHLVPKRSLSAERKRPSTPPSPSTSDIQLSSRRTVGARPAENLWPSTMRSLSVSFQSDTISIPVTKKEKPVSTAPHDRTLRPSSNFGQKQVETPIVPRKFTPERRRSPLKGKNEPDQSENHKPVDGLCTQQKDQHRWPSRIGGKVSSNELSRSVDVTNKGVQVLSKPLAGVGLSSLRRTTSDANNRPSQKSISDAARLLPLDECGRVKSDGLIDESAEFKLVSTSLADRVILSTLAVRSLSLPTPGLRQPSPGKTSLLPSSVARGVSPSRTRSSNPPSRGASPSCIRPSSSGQSNSSTSVLSFVVDFKKGKKGANYLDDAHQLRLLYNRYLQWRFSNGRAEYVLHMQRVNTERILYNVLMAILNLHDLVTRKRLNIQQLKLKFKLISVLNDQMAYLDEWAVLERDHIRSLSGAMEDLEASTLRVPLTGGARADIESLKSAICSAVSVMQAMGSSKCSLLSRVEVMNSLVSELAAVATMEKAMLDHCEALLASTVITQVEEYSLKAQLIQMQQALEELSVLAINTPPQP